MNINQLTYFCEVYRLKSFSAASINLFITIPALSTSIKTLEKELGVELFARSVHGVTPTIEGEKFYPIAQDILLKINSFKCAINSGYSEKINIYSYKAIDNKVISKIYKYATENYSDFIFNFFTKSNSEIFEILTKKNFLKNDIFILKTNINSVELLKQTYSISEEYYCKQLGEKEEKLLLAADHPLANINNITRDHIKKYPFVFLTSKTTSGGIEEYLRTLFDIQYDSDNIYFVETEEILYDLIQKKYAISIINNTNQEQLFIKYNLLCRSMSPGLVSYNYFLYNRDNLIGEILYPYTASLI